MLLFGNSNWSSPFVLSCFVALREKRLPFEVKTIALYRGEQREPAFSKQSLTSRVPVLVDGDFALSESSAIIEYIEEAYAFPAHARVLPSDIVQRARARQVMAWLRSDLHVLREERRAEYVFFPHDQLTPFAPLSPAAERAAAKLLAAAEQLIAPHAGPLFGPWCIADTDLAMMLQRLMKTGHSVSERVRAYVDAEWQRPAIQQYVAQKRPAFQRAVP